MKDRLEKFMSAEHLSSSRLAEILGVQPSNVSHILSGRNKPSFDFIEKILQRFPKINPDWFLLGKGGMYRTSIDPVVAGTKTERTPQTETTPTHELNFRFPEQPNTSLHGIPEIGTNTPGSTKFPPDEKKQLPENRINAAEPDASPVKEKNKGFSEHDRVGHGVEIERVIILFSDRTMISYKPK